MNWQLFYWLALELLLLAEKNPLLKEAMLRSAVSRAYYAAYHCACEYLKTVGQYPSEQEQRANAKESHKIVIDVFRNSPDHPAWHLIGEKLSDLKKYRQKADYQKFVPQKIFLKTPSVKGLVEQAEEIINLIRAWFKSI